jgi:hypothetical protein
LQSNHSWPSLSASVHWPEAKRFDTVGNTQITCLTANSVSLCGEQPRPPGFVSGGPHFYALGETDGEQSLAILKRTLQWRERSFVVPVFNGDFPVAGLGLFAGICSNQFHPTILGQTKTVGTDVS